MYQAAQEMGLRRDARRVDLPLAFGVRLDEGRIADLQRLFEQCDDYVRLVSGAPAGPNEAADLLAVLPHGKSYQDKFVMGLYAEPGQLVGVIDLVRDYPRPREWYVGLMLIHPKWRGQGLGETLLRQLEAQVRAKGGWTLHCAVQRRNAGAIRFLERLGFEKRGIAIQLMGEQENDVWRMAKHVVE